MFKLLKGKIDDLNVITGKEEEYKNSTLIVPSYLTKGLEFDVVMVADAGIDVYKEDELDIKLLYVSMTRALHKLCIYYHGQRSVLLDNVEV
jgi:DNA helicase-2/ATP-dependent DNA helicase PcrA